MEAAQPEAEGPVSRRQRGLAVAGALLVGACAPIQALLLTTAGDTRFYAGLDLPHTAATAMVAFVASWHWLFLAALLAAQGGAVVFATRRPAYGRALLITGGAALLATALLFLFFAAPVWLGIVIKATSTMPF